MKRDETLALDRRNFLKTVGLGAAAATAPVALTTEAEAMRATPDMRAQRYRETDHVKKYYATNRR